MKPDENQLRVSLVVPMKDESNSLAQLVESIEKQTFQPAEIVLVDGGSTDGTIEIAENLAEKNPRIKLIKTPQASPGKGRNIGIEKAQNEWIALTDAGIKLDRKWLEKLVEKIFDSPSADLIYGDYSPVSDSLFEKCAAISYVAPKKDGEIRGKFTASSMLKKKVWETVGGFPDLRAAEDLIFMESAENAGFKPAFAPEAKVYWELRPNFVTTFQKFALYSKYNIWANRAWDWHYGIVRNYVLIVPFILLAFFHSRLWLFGVLAWLAARTAKRILAHRFEFGLKTLFNPLIFGGVALLILTTDISTFVGWAQAILSKVKSK